MTRRMGSRVTRTRTPDLQTTELADTSVEWSARVVQPRRPVEPDSGQPVIVAVSAPVELDGAVEIGVGDRWLAAEWIGEAGQERQATATLPPLPAGTSQKVRARARGTTLRAAGRIDVNR